MKKTLYLLLAFACSAMVTAPTAHATTRDVDVQRDFADYNKAELKYVILGMAAVYEAVIEVTEAFGSKADEETLTMVTMIASLEAASNQPYGTLPANDQAYLREMEQLQRRCASELKEVLRLYRRGNITSNTMRSRAASIMQECAEGAARVDKRHPEEAQRIGSAAGVQIGQRLAALYKGKIGQKVQEYIRNHPGLSDSEREIVEMRITANFFRKLAAEL